MFKCLQLYIFKNNKNTACGARTHDHKIKSLALYQTELNRLVERLYSLNSHTGTRTRVDWVKASYPNRLDYMGMVVAVGFEPTKHNAHELESCPVDHLGTLPYI